MLAEWQRQQQSRIRGHYLGRSSGAQTPADLERRHQSRFRVERGDEICGELDAQHARTTVRVADLSLGGAGLVLAGASVDPQRSFHLALHGAEQWLGESAVDVVHVREGERLARLGVRFRQPSEPFLQTICRFLVDRHCQSAERPHFVESPEHFEVCSDAKLVRKLVAHCHRQRIPVRMHRWDGRPLGTLAIRGVNGAALTAAHMAPPAGLELAPGGRYYLVASTFSSVYVLLAPLRLLDGGQLGFELPVQMMVGTSRKHFRLGLDDDFPVHIEFIHPHVPGKLVRKLAREVGPGGLSFDLKLEDDLLVPGTVVDSAILRMPDGRSLSCRAVVRHVWRHGSGLACGVECVNFTAGDRWHWMRALLSRAHPNITTADAASLDDVWDVFDRSGYLEEKPIELMQAMREPFRQAWGALAAARGDSQTWLYRDRGHAVATVSMSRIYSNTWLFHHLGADLFHFERKHENLEVIAQLALRTAPQWVAGLHREGYALTYFNAHTHFNRWSWFGFFEQHDGRGELVSQPVRLFDCRMADALSGRQRTDVRVCEASPEQQRWISHDLLRRDGPLVHAAFDLSPETITLPAVTGSPHDDALARQRWLYVATSGGSVRGYAVVECAAPGVNIFSLYDTCRIVLTAGGARRDAERARDALFLQAARLYRGQQRPCFLLVVGEGDALPPEGAAGFEVEVYRTVMTLPLLLRWAESVDRVWTQGWPSE